MLSCTAFWKSLNDNSLISGDEDGPGIQRSPASTEAIRNLTAQDLALKLSEAHRPRTVSNLSREGQLQKCTEPEAGPERGKRNERSSSSIPARSIIGTSSKDRVLGDIRDNTSKSGRLMLQTSSGAVETMMEEEESKERISQVQPGVFITLVSLKEGGNELKGIKFSHELFSKWQAQRWWAENYDKVKTLYNVHAYAKNESTAVPTAPTSDDERDSKTQEFSGAGKHVVQPSLLRGGLYASPTSSSRDADRSDDLQSRDQSSEQELVEEDEPGVHVIILCSPTGSRKIKRVKFSREKFSDMQARLWWEENRVRIHEKYI